MIRSETGGHTSHLGPDPEGLGLRLAMISGAGVCGTAEEICNLIVDKEEALRLPGELEASHDPLASSRRLMRVLHTVV
jgi:hypothetical protein